MLWDGFPPNPQGSCLLGEYIVLTHVQSYDSHVQLPSTVTLQRSLSQASDRLWTLTGNCDRSDLKTMTADPGPWSLLEHPRA